MNVRTDTTKFTDLESDEI